MKRVVLIQQLIETLGLDNDMDKGQFAPEEDNTLVMDEYGEAVDGTFRYSSVIGILLYLSEHAHPGVAFAMNCCT